MQTRSLIPADEAVSLVLADSARHAEAGIVSRTVVQTSEMRVTLFAFAAGQELTPHASPRRALIQILGGACEFFHSGAWHALAAGTLLHLPPGHEHAVRASSGDFTMLLTLVTTPAA